MNIGYMEWRFQMNEALKKCTHEQLVEHINDLLDLVGEDNFSPLTDDEIGIIIEGEDNESM